LIHEIDVYAAVVAFVFKGDFVVVHALIVVTIISNAQIMLLENPNSPICKEQIVY